MFGRFLLASLASSQSLGSWVNIGSSGVVCIHTANLPNNKLLCYARPHMPPYPINQNTNGLLSAEIDLMHKVNSDGTWESKFTSISVESNPFCGGHALLGDGSILAVGGDNQSMPLTGGPIYVVNGRQAIRKFVPCASDAPSTCVGTWVDQPSMSSERWYPSVATLADGSAIIIGGQTKNIDFDNLLPTDNNPTYEYFPAKSGSWPKVLDILVWAYPHNLYPQTFLLPSGRVFVLVSNKTIIIDPKNEEIINLPDIPVMDHSPWIYPHTPTMFVLPLTIKNNFEFTLMICGGSKLSTKDASSDCLQITPESSSPKWTVAPSMPEARLMPDAVILPDGKILVVNGLSAGQGGGNIGQVQYASGPVLATHMFDPITKSWSNLAPASNMRLYHSGALLLQTGHVITTGSEMDNYNDYWGPNPNPNCYPRGYDVCTQPFNYNIERFTPPYMQKGPVPIIKQCVSTATHGSLIKVELESTANINMVTFVRTASTTHSVNSDQRLVELRIMAKTDTALFIRLPSNTALSPIGNWYLFVLNDDSVPSVAAVVNLKLGASTTVEIPPEATKISAGESSANSISVAFIALVTGILSFAVI